jgi:putative transposase
MPRRKAKRTARLACRFTTGTLRIEADGRHVTLPRMGTIRLHGRAGQLRERIVAGTARILSASVRHESGRWFVAFQTETRRDIKRVARPDVSVGIDLGVTHLAVMADSTGEIRYAPNPQHLDTALVHLRRLDAGRRPSAPRSALPRWQDGRRSRLRCRRVARRTDPRHRDRAS